jgi:hypothetical protein
MVYKYESGLWQAGSYQASGRPWVTASLDIGTLADGGDPAFEIVFPNVTRWIIVRNHDNPSTKEVKVAFSPTGYDTFNFFTVHGHTGTGASMYEGGQRTERMELKITKLYLSGSSDKVDVIAGLTDIKISNLTGSWSGLPGVG